MPCGAELGWLDWAFMALVVLALFAARWNTSALALAASWLLGQVTWLVTCDNLPYEIYILCDYMVIVAICCAKPELQDCSPYRSVWAVLYCMLWRERNDFDRAILAIFPFAWLFYLEPLGERATYATLWLLTAAQILIACSESYYVWQEARAKRAAANSQSEPPPSDLDFALARGLRRHG